MTRWLKASQQVGTRDKWDNTDKTPVMGKSGQVLSLKSVLSSVPMGEAGSTQSTSVDMQKPKKPFHNEGKETQAVSLKAVKPSAPEEEFSDAVKEEGQQSPYGHTVGGSPKTWTGKIVGLAEWRELSEWDKHGSTGKHWNGLSRQWEEAP